MGGEGRGGTIGENCVEYKGGNLFMIYVGIVLDHELRGTCTMYGRPFSFS